jgi:hypothetical protein
MTAGGVEVGRRSAARWGRCWLPSMGSSSEEAGSDDGHDGTSISGAGPTDHRVLREAKFGMPGSRQWSPSGRCCSCLLRGALRPRRGLASDRQGQLVECDRHPPGHRFLDGQFVMATPQVLDEGVPGDHGLGAAVLLVPSHRTQPRPIERGKLDAPRRAPGASRATGQNGSSVTLV